MKVIKSVIIGKIFLIFATLFSLVSFINAMKPTKYTKKTTSVAQQRPTRQLGLEDVWVQTSDDKIIAVPLWQFEQMTELYQELLQQDGKNGEQNPFKTALISSGELASLQDAFIKAAKGLFQYHPGKMTQLEEVAGRVGAKSLSALLAKSVLPQEIQTPMVSEIIKEVVSYIKNPQNAIINLLGHGYFVTCLAFSKNGKFFVSGSHGIANNLIVWDAVSLQQKTFLNGHSGNVTCVAISPDNQYIISGAKQGNHDNLILWNVGAQKFKKLSSKWFFSSIGHGGDVTCVAFSPDGKYVVSGATGEKNNLILWDVHAKKQKYAFDGHIKDVTCVAFSPDGNYIASGSADRTVRLWDSKTGKLLDLFEGHPASVLCLAFDGGSTKIISGSAGTEYTLLSWKIKPKAAKSLIVNRRVGSANCIEFSPDGKYFFVGGGTYLEMWDADTEEIIHSYDKQGAITALAVSYDNCCFAAGTLAHKQNVIIGNIAEKNANFFSISKHTTCLAFNPADSNVLIIGSEGGTEEEYYGKTLHCLKRYNPQVLVDLEQKLTIPQAYFLYRLYKARINNDVVVIDEHDQDYAAYEAMPFDVKQLIKTFFPFKVVEKVFPFATTSKTFKQAVQEKKKVYKPLFVGLTINEKIAKIKQIMSLIEDKNSVDYKACQEILNEFEVEVAFEA
jgi:WD40 repeat protein